MTRTDADQCRATGIWPVRPMTPFEPLPTPPPPRLSRARRALEIAWAVIVALVFSAAPAALLTCWPRAKRERRSVERLGAGVRLKLPNYLRRMAVGRSTKSDFSLRGAATTAFL
jgi:hypothetical protein